MEYNELVSVVMPVHNGELFLREAIESVLNQTYSNFELLIIENCPTDSSAGIIASFEDERIRLIIEEDCGQVHAYNRGFKEAKGEYIFIHDHDDVSHHERFEKQLEFITTHKLDILGSYYSLVNKNGDTLTLVKPPLMHRSIQVEYFYKVTSLYNPTLCIKKSVFINFGYFENKYFPSSDFEFGLRVLPFVRVGNIPKFLLMWRNHKSSLSHRDIKFGMNNALLLACKYLELNKGKYTREEYIFIKANIYYYYNKLFKSLKVIINNFSIADSALLLLAIKILLFFIPIKILRVNDLFNSKFVLLLRRYSL